MYPGASWHSKLKALQSQHLKSHMALAAGTRSRHFALGRPDPHHHNMNQSKSQSLFQSLLSRSQESLAAACLRQ